MSNNTYWAEAAADLNFVEDGWTDNFGTPIREGKLGLATGDVVIEGTLEELRDMGYRIIAAVDDRVVERLSRPRSTCRHCEREIVLQDGRWIDEEATGDDSVWRETCDSHNTFDAVHEPATDDGEAEDQRLIRKFNDDA